MAIAFPILLSGANREESKGSFSCPKHNEEIMQARKTRDNDLTVYQVKKNSSFILIIIIIARPKETVLDVQSIQPRDQRQDRASRDDSH